MADIRINALATTAASTASDDFLAVDGSANGTRKLSAYSPTFSGNLTVSGVTTSAGVSNSGALTFTAAAGQIAGSIAKNATYGLTYYGVTGSSNDNTMLNASGAVVLSNPAGTTNATLTGNLTVSGAINVAGNVLGTSTGNDEWKILRGADTNYSLLTFRDTAGNNEWVIGRRVDSVAGAGNFSFYSTSLGANALTLALVSGNVLIGTTTDGGQKLQVSGTANITSNLTVGGTVIATSRVQGNELQISGGGSNNAGTIYSDANWGMLFKALQASPSVADFLFLDSAGSERLRMTSTNATFAGNIKTAAPSGGTAATWRLGTVASVSPTSPNRTIEVEIGGTTYYIHAKTTND